MKLFCAALVASLACFGCSKPIETREPEFIQPPTKYVSLGDIAIPQNSSKSLDINEDGLQDFLFKVDALGEPDLGQDRFRFAVEAKTTAYLLKDAGDQTPVFSENQIISYNPSGYLWTHPVSVQLAEKIHRTNGIDWSGNWMNVQHKFLAIQLHTEQRIYNGWVELSIDKTQSVMILHRAALSQAPNRLVKAGM